jgi:DNA-binding CsgD family transcriptional regulator
MSDTRNLKLIARAARPWRDRFAQMDRNRQLVLIGNVLIVAVSWFVFILAARSRPDWFAGGLLLAAAYTAVAGASALLLARRRAASPGTQVAVDGRQVPNTNSSMDRWRGAGCLTAQERRVVELVCSGLSNRRVGDALYISLATVKSHVYNIYRKLEVGNRWELIRRFGTSPEPGPVPASVDASAPATRGARRP